MSKISLGIIGGGQLGSLLCTAAKNININTMKSKTSSGKKIRLSSS